MVNSRQCQWIHVLSVSEMHNPYVPEQRQWRQKPQPFNSKYITGLNSADTAKKKTDLKKLLCKKKALLV